MPLLYRILPGAVLCVCALGITAPADADADADAWPEHLKAAVGFVKNVEPARNKSGPACTMIWGTSAAPGGIAFPLPYYGETQSACFVTKSLKRGGYSNTNFKCLWKTEDPTSNEYYDFIVQEVGFIRILNIDNVEAGDLIVVRPPFDDFGPDGHVMIVRDKPKLIVPTHEPIWSDTAQWTTIVVDSTAKPHGVNDGRSYVPGAVGTGPIRIYVDKWSSPAPIFGFTWSPEDAAFYPTPSAPANIALNYPKRSIVIGRPPSLTYVPCDFPEIPL